MARSSSSSDPDRPERVPPDARWCGGDGWLTVVAGPPAPGPLARHAGGADDRSAAQRYTNTAIYAEPLDDPDALWVHELIGAEVVEVSGTPAGHCVAVVANPAADLLELDSGALVPVVFVIERRDDMIVIDPPDGLFDDDEDDA